MKMKLSMKKFSRVLPALLLAASCVRAETIESASSKAENLSLPSLQVMKARAASMPAPKAVLAKEVLIRPGDSVFIRGKDSVAAIAYEALLEDLLVNAKQIYQDYGRDGILCLNANGACVGKNSAKGISPQNGGAAVRILRFTDAQSNDGSLKPARITLTNGYVVCSNPIGYASCGLVNSYQFDLFANGEIQLDKAPMGLTLADPAVRKVLGSDIKFFIDFGQSHRPAR